MIRITIILLFICGIANGQAWTNIYGKNDYKDSLRFSKLKNNVSGDSVLSTDNTGKLRMKYITGSAAIDTAFLIHQLGDAKGVPIVIGTKDDNPLKFIVATDTVAKFDDRYNISLGVNSFLNNTTGSNNTALSTWSLHRNTTGIGNIGIGMYALDSNVTGNYNTALGYNADVLTSGLIRATAIGANAKVGKSNSIVLGDTSTVTNIGIGTAYPDSILHIKGHGIKIEDGTQGVGKVLTSDANGGASWQTVSSSDSTKVPYTGATGNVDLGLHTLYASQVNADSVICNYVNFSLPTPVTTNKALRWNISNGDVSYADTTKLIAGTNISSITNSGQSWTINAATQTTDTSSLSTRINQRVKYTDTLSMLSAYSTAINTKLNKADSTTGGYYPYSSNPKGFLTTASTYIDSIRLVNTGILHTTPATFSLSGKTGVITQTLATQSAYQLFGTGSSTATPTFRNIDSNYFNGSFKGQVLAATSGSYLTPSDTTKINAGVNITVSNTGKNFTINADTSTSASKLATQGFVSRSYQPTINGTGFVKASGTTISYDNSTYLTTSTAASTYAPLASPSFTGTVSINNGSPSASAALDIASTTQGFLPPRMTTTQRNSISSPATGLMIYNTTTNSRNTYDGTRWSADKWQSYNLGGVAAWAPAASTTYYWSNYNRNPSTSSATTTGGYIIVGETGIITTAFLQMSNGNSASSGDISIYLNNITQSTSTLIATVNTSGAVLRDFSNTNMNMAVTAGDKIEVKMVTPAWGTAPTSVYIQGNFQQRIF